MEEKFGRRALEENPNMAINLQGFYDEFIKNTEDYKNHIEIIDVLGCGYN